MLILRSRLLLGLMLFAAAVALNGCPSSRFLPLGGTTVGTVKLEDAARVPDESGPVPISNDAFVVGYTTYQLSFQIACYDRDLLLRWKADISQWDLGAEAGVAEFRSRNARLIHYRDHLGVFEFGDNYHGPDSIYAIARWMHADGGKLDSAKCLSRMERKHSLDNQDYGVALSPDSSCIAVFVNDLNSTEDSILVRVTVVDSTLAIIGNGIVKAFPINHPAKTCRIAVNNDGTIYDATLDDANAIYVTKHARGTMKPGRTVMVMAPAPWEPVKRRLSISVALIDSAHLWLDAIRTDETLLLGTPCARVDVRTMTLDFLRDDPLSLDTLLSPYGVHVFQGPMLNSRHLTRQANANHITVVEHSSYHPPGEMTKDWHGRWEAGSAESHTTGSLLVLAMDTNGIPRWQRFIARENRFTDSRYRMATSSIRHLDNAGTLRIVYGTNGALMLHDLRLCDGSNTSDSVRAIAAFGDAFVETGAYSCWLDDQAFYFISVAGTVFSHSLNVNRIILPK